MNSRPVLSERQRHRLGWTGYTLALLLAPLLFDSGLGQTLVAQTGIAIIACLSYNLLLGQGGMLSFGHAVYSGTGAFAVIHLLHLAGAGWPLPVSLMPLAGGAASLALALLLGWVTTQKSGTAFAMITLGMGELVWALAQVVSGWFGGEAGVSGNRVTGSAPWGISFGPLIELNDLIAVYTLVCTALLYGFTRTPLGYLLNAVRDNPERVAFMGHNPHLVRYLAFAVSAFFAGVAGGLAALNFEMVTTEVFSAQRSGAYLLFTVLGGTGTFFGPVIGAVLMVLCFVLLSGLTPAWLLYVGLAFALAVIYAPGGLTALLQQLWQQRGGRWHGHGILVRATAVLLALAGGVALVEMFYHWQQRAVLGPHLHLVGIILDVSRPWHWLGAGLLGGLGLLLLQVGPRGFARARR